MKHQVLIVAAVGFSLGLGGIPGAAFAQETQEDITATNGDAAALGTGNASSAPGTVTRGGGSGTSLLGPDGTYHVTEVSPPTVNAPDNTDVEIVPAAERDPVPEAPAEEVAPDTDGDGVVDGDEIGVYGTDPNTWDTDGDGLSDGDELFVAGTDPFVWDTDGDGVSDGGIAAAVEAEPLAGEDGAAVVADETASAAASVDGDGDRLADADETAVGTDPANPDTDGDGYYDGDEVILGSDPHDPANFPAPQS
jgi:hypothetical protein